MVDAAGIQRIGQRADDVLLPDQFGETLRAPFAGEDEIGHGHILPRAGEICPHHDERRHPDQCGLRRKPSPTTRFLLRSPLVHG